MELDVQPGRYVVAVSGGVDSVTLLHALCQCAEVELIVAHFNHGIRPDANEDRKLVQSLAESYSLPFFYDDGKLGPQASEATARYARYAFLKRVQSLQGADAIITAHHLDDVLETAILNLLRGTGRRGLTSLASTQKIVRPLLGTPKSVVVDYAKQHGLVWREDSTNRDDRYLRNYIRLRILPRFDSSQRAALEKFIVKMRSLNQDIDTILKNVLAVHALDSSLDRLFFLGLPHTIAKELLAAWWRTQGITSYNTKMLERVTIAAKTQPPGSIIDIVGSARLRVYSHYLALERHER